MILCAMKYSEPIVYLGFVFLECVFNQRRRKVLPDDEEEAKLYVPPASSAAVLLVCNVVQQHSLRSNL